MDELLTDQQQAEVVRNWLRDNGGFILGGLVLGLGGLFGWNYWQGYKDMQAEQASALYEDIIVAIRIDQSTRAEDLVIDLERSYGNSPYLDQSRLMLAKSYLDRSEFDTAVDYLEKIVSGSKSAQMKHIARLRLARVRLQQQQLETALSTLEQPEPDTAFAARYHDARGDIYVAMKRPGDARKEYEKALSIAEQPPVIDRVYVQAKLDDLGAAPVAGADVLAVEAAPSVPAAADDVDRDGTSADPSDQE